MSQWTQTFQKEMSKTKWQNMFSVKSEESDPTNASADTPLTCQATHQRRVGKILLFLSVGSKNNFIRKLVDTPLTHLVCYKVKRWRTVAQLSADCRETVSRLLTNCRPTFNRLLADVLVRSGSLPVPVFYMSYNFYILTCITY